MCGIGLVKWLEENVGEWRRNKEVFGGWRNKDIYMVLYGNVRFMFYVFLWLFSVSFGFRILGIFSEFLMFYGWRDLINGLINLMN